jgi:2,4-dienoyl-CoA reductase-like NADH-dependent reductase (Old Yellow Enzyme family)
MGVEAKTEASTPGGGPLPLLFTPGRIGGVEIKNRIVMPSMTTRAADKDGFVTDDTLAYYCERADGGVGLITVEMASPERAGRHRNFELGIYDDRFVPGLSRLVDALHARNARVSIQLGHAGGHTRPDVTGGEPPVAPSAIAHVVQEGTTETIIPEAMSRERIERAIDAFAEAAARAARAGFDIVEVHAAHGYLISQFLCPVENRRDDEYGGSIENRARFGIAIVQRIKARVPDFPVIFRLNGDDFVEGGMTSDEARQVAIWAAEAGADAIHVTGGHYRSVPSAAVMIPPMAMPDATFLRFAADIRAHVKVPVIAVGRLGDPALALRAVQDGQADFVALGRPLLADPGWVNSAIRGKAVRMCIACNSCVDGMRSGERLHCLVNPVTGRERLFGNITERASRVANGLKIVVVGAGPAGLSYAALLAPWNVVTIFEKDNMAGGAFRLAGLAAKFQGVEASPTSLPRYIASLECRCREAGTTFVFGCDITRDVGRLEGFDLIVLATGADYRAGLGLIPLLLRAGLARLPGLRAMASNPAIREWFYHRARVSSARRLQSRLGDKAVLVIGDAATPGKSDAAIRSAFDAALQIPTGTA